MSFVLKCAAVGGLLAYLQIRRPEVYLKESRRARLGLTITKWLIVIAFVALLIAAEQFFISKLMF